MAEEDRPTRPRERGAQLEFPVAQAPLVLNGRRGRRRSCRRRRGDRDVVELRQLLEVRHHGHLDAPILRFIRLNELGALPPIVNALLDQLKSELPSREQLALAALEKKKEEQAKRKATVNAPKTTARGKKTTKADALSSVPTSNATTDNRPRPEVNVPTNPQQQIGLF